MPLTLRIAVCTPCCRLVLASHSAHTLETHSPTLRQLDQNVGAADEQRARPNACFVLGCVPCQVLAPPPHCGRVSGSRRRALWPPAAAASPPPHLTLFWGGDDDQTQLDVFFPASSASCWQRVWRGRTHWLCGAGPQLGQVVVGGGMRRRERAAPNTHTHTESLLFYSCVFTA